MFQDIFGSQPLAEAEFMLEQQVKNTQEFLDKFENTMTYSLYKTRCQFDIYEVLFRTAQRLQNGQYVDRRGEASFALIGDRGIGKTTAMQTFAVVCPRCVSNLFCIYVSFSNTQCNEWLKYKSLAHLVMSVLIDDMKIIVPDRSDLHSVGEKLVFFLKSINKRMLIFADDIDNLYKLNNEVHLQTLHDLLYFADQSSGCIATVVCGSSSHMVSLLRATSNPALRSKFPLLNNAIDLNGTKYVATRVPSSLPVDLVACAQLCGVQLNANNMEGIRLLAFTCGVNARRVNRMHNDQARLSMLNLSESLHDEPFGDVTDVLLRKIMKRMSLQNITLLKALLNSSAIDFIHNIAAINWEIQFKPLMYRDVKEVWQNMKPKYVQRTETDQLDYHLLQLSDRGLIVFVNMIGTHPETFYPATMLQLTTQHIRESELPEVQSIIVDYLKKAPGDLARAVQANPRAVVMTGVSIGMFASSCTVM